MSRPYYTLMVGVKERKGMEKGGPRVGYSCWPSQVGQLVVIVVVKWEQRRQVFLTEELTGT